MRHSPLRYITAADIAAAMPPAEAASAIESALRRGFDPADDSERAVVPTRNGQFLIMPAEAGAVAGVKIATVNPGNGARGFPRIQAAYFLFDSETLTPTAILDGIALTNIRTSAVSMVAIRPALQRSPRALRLVVFGAGPQGRAHAKALSDLVGTDRIESVAYVVRTPDNVSSPPEKAALHRSESDAARHALSEADVVVCATSSAHPLFDSADLADDVVVVAVGSHEPHARELDAKLMGRSQVIVEDVATALREAGDVIQAINEGSLTADDLVPLADLVTGTTAVAAAGPIVFKSTGMSWEDLVIAEAIVQRSAPTESRDPSAPSRLAAV